MHLIKERLDVEESLEKRIKNTLKFLNIKSKIIKGNIISIPKRVINTLKLWLFNFKMIMTFYFTILNISYC